MILLVKHTTDYRYTAPLRYALQTLWLTPQSSAAQTVNFWSVGAPEKLFEQTDGFGNVVQSYTFVGNDADNVRWSLVNAAGEVNTHGVPEFVDPVGLPHPYFFLRGTTLAEPHYRLAEFGKQFIAQSLDGTASLQALLALSAGVMRVISYKKDSSNVTTTALQAFENGNGVCQDQAHVMVAICRSLGYPARYVSGYFYDANAPELASHAWADVCLNVATRRWVSIDVTHACLTDGRHIRLAMGGDYNACPPAKGVRQGGGKETMTVSITIKAA